MSLAFDHLVVLATTLGDGATWIAEALGAELAPGGKHPAMGTENALLSLGPDAYLEVIAVDPTAPDPGRARWFGLDTFRGPPRLGHWAVRTDDIDEALRAAPPALGRAVEMARGAHRWRISVPDDGRLPFDGAAPSLIQWTEGPHPGQVLPDTGCRLDRLEIEHPEAEALVTGFAGLLTVGQVGFMPGPRPGLTATIATPRGRLQLG